MVHPDRHSYSDFDQLFLLNSLRSLCPLQCPVPAAEWIFRQQSIDVGLGDNDRRSHRIGVSDPAVRRGVLLLSIP